MPAVNERGNVMSTKVWTEAARVEAASTHLVLYEPLYSSLLMGLKVVESADPECPTFRTDGRSIQYNPKFSASLKPREIVTVLCEEVLHNGLGHLWRIPEGASLRDWNTACDHEIRLIFEEANAEARARGQEPPFPIPFPEKYGPNPKYKGMAAEMIYAAMMRERDGSGQKSADSGQTGQQGSGQQGQQGQPGGPSGSSDSQGDGCPSLGEFAAPPSDPAAQKELKQYWENALLNAARVPKSRGHIPAAIVRMVDQIVDPKVDWRDMVRDWARFVVRDNYDWMRPNRRYMGTGFLMPSLYSEKVGRIAIARDTSSSIDETLNAQFLAEAQQMLDELNPEALVDITCDTKVYTVREYSQGDKIATDCPGGGGTDFRPVFDEIETWDEQPVALVFFTDLDGRFPDTPPEYPVLWVTYNTRTTPPWGEHVKIERPL